MVRPISNIPRHLYGEDFMAFRNEDEGIVLFFIKGEQVCIKTIKQVWGKSERKKEIL